MLAVESEREDRGRCERRDRERADVEEHAGESAAVARAPLDDTDRHGHCQSSPGGPNSAAPARAADGADRDRGRASRLEREGLPHADERDHGEDSIDVPGREPKIGAELRPPTRRKVQTSPTSRPRRVESWRKRGPLVVCCGVAALLLRQRFRDAREWLAVVAVLWQTREPLARVPEALPEQERRHTAHRDQRPTLPPALDPPRPLVGLVTFFGVSAQHAQRSSGLVRDVYRNPRRDRVRGGRPSRSSSTTARSRSAPSALSQGAALFGPRAALCNGHGDIVSSRGARNGSGLTACSSTSARSRSRRSRQRPRSSRRNSTGELGEPSDRCGRPRRRRRLLRGQYQTGSMSELAVEGRENLFLAHVLARAGLWLAPHYIVYGSIGGVIAIGYPRQGSRAGGLPPCRSC